MRNVQAMRKLINALSYLSVCYERTSTINAAEHILEDAVIALWNHPATIRAAYFNGRDDFSRF